MKTILSLNHDEPDTLALMDDEYFGDFFEDISEYIGQYILIGWNDENMYIQESGNSVDDVLTKVINENLRLEEQEYYDDMFYGATSKEHLIQCIKESEVDGDSNYGYAIILVPNMTEVTEKMLNELKSENPDMSEDEIQELSESGEFCQYVSNGEIENY